VTGTRAGTGTCEDMGSQRGAPVRRETVLSEPGTRSRRVPNYAEDGGASYAQELCSEGRVVCCDEIW
jgi:hypothetical protein